MNKDDILAQLTEIIEVQKKIAENAMSLAQQVATCTNDPLLVKQAFYISAAATSSEEFAKSVLNNLKKETYEKVG